IVDDDDRRRTREPVAVDLRLRDQPGLRRGTGTVINAIKFAIEEIEASDQYFDHTRSGLARGTRRPFSACQRRRCGMFTGIITPTICKRQQKRLGPRIPYRWSYRWSNNTSAAHCLRNILSSLS